MGGNPGGGYGSISRGGYTGNRGGYGGNRYGGYGYRGYGYRGYGWGGYYAGYYSPYLYGGLGWGYGYWPWYGGYYGYAGYGYDAYPYSYADPAYTSSYAYPAYYASSPGVTMVYAPANTQTPVAEPYQQRPNPVMREYDSYGQELGRGSSARAELPPIYLIALQDHTILAAEAYWLENGILHYVTLQHEQKQIPVAGVDRGLSERLNRERRVPFTLSAGQ